MKKLLLKTNNLIWATCIAGCISTAKTSPTNPPFSFTLCSDNEAVKELSKAFPSWNKNEVYEEIHIPDSEDEYTKIDLYSSTRLKKELLLLHGIDSEETYSQLSILDMASTILLRDHDITSQPKTFYPILNQFQYKEYIEYDAVVTKSEYIEYAEKFFDGYGLKNPRILDVSSLSELEAIKSINNPHLKLLVSHTEDEILYIARSYYKGFDRISEAFCTLVIFEPNMMFGRSCVPLWGSCVPQSTTDLDSLLQRGRVRKIQELCKFNDHEYKARKQKGEFS